MFYAVYKINFFLESHAIFTLQCAQWLVTAGCRLSAQPAAKDSIEHNPAKAVDAPTPTATLGRFRILRADAKQSEISDPRPGSQRNAGPTKEMKMKIDLTKTNGTSPPTSFLTHSDHPLPSTREDEQIWTVIEVADYLKMSPRQVWELTRRRGQERSEFPLPCFKIHSKCLRFRRSDVIAWLDALAQKARLQ